MSTAAPPGMSRRTQFRARAPPRSPAHSHPPATPSPPQHGRRGTRSAHPDSGRSRRPGGRSGKHAPRAARPHTMSPQPATSQCGTSPGTDVAQSATQDGSTETCRGPAAARSHRPPSTRILPAAQRASWLESLPYSAWDPADWETSARAQSPRLHRVRTQRRLVSTLALATWTEQHCQL